VLVEDEPSAVTVTVRDDGLGIEPGRLEEAARDGRLGFAVSVRRRIEDLGGRVSVITGPGQGAEIELSIPKNVGRA
jgi:signal transduction histidine kinase